MLTRVVAIAAWAVAFAGTACAQGTSEGARTGHPRPDAGSTSSAKPQPPSSVPPSSTPPPSTTGSTSLLPGAGLIVVPEDGGKPPRPEASPGTPANPSGLKKPD